MYGAMSYGSVRVSSSESGDCSCSWLSVQCLMVVKCEERKVRR